MTTRTERGFSLVELMVAMTVTLIVSGAIYGLLTSGSNAFRREPEVADRQQNIRVAMDLISRDVFNAGAALPTFAQVFTRADPAGGGCTGTQGLNGCGDPGTMGATAAANRAPGDGGDASTNSDVLEIVTTSENCPPQTVCAGVPGSAGVIVTREPMGACVTAPGLALIANNQAFAIQPAFDATGAPQTCTGVGSNGNVNVLAAVAPWTPAVAIPANPTPFLYAAQVVRYRIAPGTDPTDPSPSLWRSSSGRYARDGSVVSEPDEVSFPDPASPWDLVARGIEDLQIEYRAGDGLWRNLPPVSAANDWTTLVREVRITLSARVTAGNLQGETVAAGGPNAIRGQLTTVVAPRAAFNELQMGEQIQ